MAAKTSWHRYYVTVTLRITKRPFSEAEQAVGWQKPTLAVQMEAGYKPDGWLAPLCLNNLLCDFSVPQNFDDEWSKLRDRLTQMKLGANNPDEGSSPQETPAGGSVLSCLVGH